MINLLLTRSKYLKKNYIFIILSIIPIIIIISLSIYVQSEKSDIDTFEKKLPQKISSYSLFNTSENININEYLNTIIADEDECDNFKNFYKKDFSCITEEKFRDNDEYYHAFSISRKKGKYQIKIFDKDYYYKGKKIFFNLSLKENDNIEIFKYENKNYTNLDIIDLDLYLKFLTYFTKYIISREKKNEANKPDLDITFGLNIFPKIRYVEELYLYLSYIFIFLFYFIFAVYQYFFFIIIKNENQKGLNVFLYNNGFATSKYVLSMFLFYISLLGIPSFILFILSFLFSYHPFLFLLNLLFYLIASFCFCCFILLIINKKRFFISIYTSLFFIVIFSIKSNFHKSIKIILTFIPDINFMFSLNTFFKLNSFKKISYEELMLDINRICYNDCILMHLFNIVSYIIISFIILYHRQSELDFFTYLSQFFNSKKKEEQKIDNNNLLINNENSPNNNINNENNQKDCLKINNLQKIYNSVKIIDNLNLEIFSDEIYCLFSENKISTNYLIKIIAGIIKPSYGDILLNGEENKNNENVVAYINKEVFFDYLSVEEYIKFLFKIKKINIENDINSILERIELNEIKDSLCKQLNDLQKIMLSLSSVLIGNPKIILLEEPLKNLSDENKIKITDFIKELKKDKIIFITTDSIIDAQNLGDKIGIMSNNHIIFSDTINKFNSLCENDSSIIDLNIYINSNNFTEEKYHILIEKIKEYEPNLNISFKNKEILIIKINSNNNEINTMLDCIEKSKEELGIEDYTLTNSNSFEIFLEKIKLTESKISNENDIIINDNSNIGRTRGFWSRLFKQYKYNFVLFRKKSTYILSLIIICDFFIFFCIFYHHLNFIPNTFETIKLLEGNPIYFYSKKKNFLTKSDIYEHFSRYIYLIEIEDKPYNIENFIEFLYDKSYAHIAKSGISIKESSNKFEVYITEIYNKDFGYLFANLVFVFSAYLKKVYNIDASILTSYTLIPTFFDSTETEFDYERTTNIFMKIISFIFLFPIIFSLRNCYLFYEIVNDRIKYRNALNEFSFYLYGEKLLNNWIVSLLVDYIKIFFFSFLYFYPISLFIDLGYYFLSNIPFISLSTLLFLYLFSNVFSEIDKKTKQFYFAGYLVILPILLTFILLISKDLDSLVSFSLLSLFPIFSYIFTYLFLFYKLYFKERKINEMKYIYYNYLTQIISILLYSLLLYLYNKGYLKKFNIFKYFRKDSYENPKEIISEEFINRNELNEFEDQSQNNPQINNINNINVQESKNNNDDINTDINKIENNSPLLENNNNLSENLISENNENLENINLILKIKDLKKTYYGKTNITVFNDLNLDLEKNEKFCLIGPSNCGKSTLIKLIMKEIDHENGQILLLGNQNKKIGYCPQNDYFVEYKTVKEIIEYYIYLKSSPDTLDSICQNYELYDYLDTYYINLSVENKKKLKLAIALMGNPELLILDEPSSDLNTKKMLKNKINELIKNRHNFSMLLCTKSIEEGEMICDRVSWIKEGSLYLCDSLPRIKIENNSVFKLVIKFDVSKAKQENLSKNEMNQQLFYDILALVEKVDKYNNHFSKIKCFIKSLINISNNIKEYTYKIKLIQISKDLSFTLVVGIKKEKQKEFYSSIFNIKNNNEEIQDLLIW